MYYYVQIFVPVQFTETSSDFLRSSVFNMQVVVSCQMVAPSAKQYGFISEDAITKLSHTTTT